MDESRLKCGQQQHYTTLIFRCSVFFWFLLHGEVERSVAQHGVCGMWDVGMKNRASLSLVLSFS
jgi:hypothetical protein